MWLDGADINTMYQDVGATNPVTATGQTINAWKDKSKNGYLFTALNTGPSPNGPTYTASGLNGLGVTSWSGNQILQSSTTFPFYTDAFSGGSFFGVFNPTYTASQRFLMFYQNQSNALVCGSSTEFGYGINNVSGTIGLHQGCGNATLTTSGLLSAGNNTIISYILGTSGTTPANSSIYLNSTSYTSFNLGTGFYSAGSYPSANNAQKLNIGGRYIQYVSANPDCMHIGTIAELIWYNGPVSETRSREIEGYLAAKWGLRASLPVTHPYKTIAPYNQPFRPTDIPGCALWLDGADPSQMTLIGSTIGQWRDKSGNNNTATPQSSGPIYLPGGGVNMPSTAAVNYWLASPVTVPTQSHCLIAVHSPYATTGYNNGNTSLFRFQSGQYIVFPYMNGTVPRGYISSYDGTSIDAITSTLVENSVAGSKNLIIANILPNIQNIYKNGTQQSSATGSIRSETSFGLSIGDAGEYYSGILYEMLVFNTSLTNNQLFQIETYLANKWGITLAAGHPGRSLPPYSTTFTVKSIPQLLLWLDAADASTIVQSGDVITIWNDKSGSGNNLSNSDASLKSPTYSSSQVNMTPTGSYLKRTISFSTNPTSTPISLFIVANMSTYSTPVSWSDSDANALIPRWYNGLTYVGNGSAPNGIGWATATSPIILGQRYVYSVVYSGYLGTNSVWANGNNILSVSTQGPLYRDNFQLGARTAVGDFMSGSVYEVLYYNYNMSTNQRQQVEGYLAWKWGVQSQLPSSHAYAKAPP